MRSLHALAHHRKSDLLSLTGLRGRMFLGSFETTEMKRSDGAGVTWRSIVFLVRSVVNQDTP